MAKRVLFVVDSCQPSGLLTQARLLAEQLADRDFEPYFCALRPHGMAADGLRKIAPLHSAGQRHTADPLAEWKLRRLIKRLDPAIVHAWGDTATTYATAAVGPWPNTKLLATLGRAQPDRPAWRRWLDALRNRRATKLFAPSEQVAGGLRAPDVRVIPPGMAVEHKPVPAKEELFAELSLPPHARVLAITAQLAPRKAVKEMIWVFDLLRVLQDEVRLLVIGDGPERPALDRFIRLASTPEHVRMLGPRADATRLLPAAEVVWHAGDEASAPVAVLEAMAAGLPVIADSTTGCQEAITDGQNGLLVGAKARTDRVRATQRLLEDADCRARLGQAAQATVEKRFSAARLADEYACAYRECL